MPDIKGLPYPNSSAIPDGPGAFLALNTVLAGGRVFRRFATWTAMDAVGDAVTNELAIVDAVPGAWFKYDGADWVMNGAARFADATARDAALPSPAAGMQAIIGSLTWRYDGTAWVLVSRPQVLVTRVTSQTIATGTNVAVSFTAHPIMDTGFTHNTATNPTRVIVANAGTYEAILEGLWDVSTAGSRRLQIAINGTSRSIQWDLPTGSAAFPQNGTTTGIVLAAGDYVEMTVQQSVGSNLVLSTATMKLTRIA